MTQGRDLQRRSGGDLADVVPGGFRLRPGLRTVSAVLGRRAVDAITPRQALEGSVVAVLIVVLALLRSQRDAPYIVFPVLIWAALCGGPRGASGAVALVTTLTVFNTAHHAGPFLRATTTQSLLATQLFVAAAALNSLVLRAVIEERHGALEALRGKERRLRHSRALESSRPATQRGGGSSATCPTALSNASSR